VNQLALFVFLALLIFSVFSGLSNWLVSKNPLRFSFIGRHDIACYLTFLGFSLFLSTMFVLFYNLFLFFFAY